MQQEHCDCLPRGVEAASSDRPGCRQEHYDWLGSGWLLMAFSHKSVFRQDHYLILIGQGADGKILIGLPRRGTISTEWSGSRQ